MNTEFDEADQAILAALRNNARVSNKELARHCNLAESTCLERVHRLERRGVISGYTPSSRPGRSASVSRR